jgi:hypothetical protein
VNVLNELIKQTKVRCLSPQANYADRATAACQRSFAAIRIPHDSNSCYIRPRPCCIFRVKLISYGEGSLAPLPTPKLEDHPLSFARCCLFNIFAATFHIWRLFLHPQPEDSPCCGDRNPPNMVSFSSV